jgi:hypothetical protein
MLQCYSGETSGRLAVQEKNSWAVLLRLLYEAIMTMMSELNHTTPPSNYAIDFKVYLFRFFCHFLTVLVCLKVYWNA